MKRRVLTTVIAACLVLGVAAGLFIQSKYHGKILPAMAQTSEQPDETRPQHGDLPELDTSSWELKLVNDDNVLSQNFEPEVVEIENGQTFDSRAADKLREMLSEARAAGYEPNLVCGYRPFASQAYVFFEKVSSIEDGGTATEEQAKALARRYTDYPGTSEHQLGLAVDIIGREGTKLDAQDAESDELVAWLAENCAQFGFVQRYPESKESVTGKDEPWHFRYVGVEAAEYMTEHDLSLEQLLALY